MGRSVSPTKRANNRGQKHCSIHPAREITTPSSTLRTARAERFQNGAHGGDCVPFFDGAFRSVRGGAAGMLQLHPHCSAPQKRRLNFS
eukprot:scaffold7745_cov103-Cylindrotheca_fusiformis.AAC.7